ncbi:MAG: phosphoribosyltransferase family protein, partial [Nitrospiraceae bacterium]
EMEIARRRETYRQGKDLLPLTGRLVILVDDGVATGATYLASVRALRAAGVASLVAALPVAPPDTAWIIASVVDECRVLESPSPFYSVGEHYADFRQVDDDEVVRCLGHAWKPGS